MVKKLKVRAATVSTLFQDPDAPKGPADKLVSKAMRAHKGGMPFGEAAVRAASTIRGRARRKK